MNLWVVFLTGLTVGGLTCLAVQGGLLASTIAARVGQDQAWGRKKAHSVLPIIAFLLAKLISYTILGFLLGLFGQKLALSSNIQTIMQLLAGLYMVAVALNLLNIHPIFRYVIIQPPRFLTRIVRNQAKSKDLFAPALLGAMTIFIPCGTTLAMEALALSSGNAFLGAAILAVFVLGTTPLFFSVGYLTTSLGGVFQKRFLQVAAVLVLYLALTTINGALNLMGSPITLEKIMYYSPIELNLGGSSKPAAGVNMQNGQQIADITVYGAGYEPDFIEVKQGVPVKLNLKTVGEYSCTSRFLIPEFNVTQDLPQEGVTSVVFTPTKKGTFTWTCGMGMYSGLIKVI